MLLKTSAIESIITIDPMDNVVRSTVELLVRSCTASSGQGPDNVLQNPEQRDFSDDTEDTLLITPSNRKEFNAI